MILSTFHSGSNYEVTRVPSRYPNKPLIMEPNVVLDYTKHTGGVNSSDHYIASCQFMKTKKRYRKMFFWLLEVSIVNSYLLYALVQEQYSKRPITHKKFREILVESLVHEKMSTSRRMQKAKQGRPSSGPPEERLNGEPRFIERKEKGSGACVV
jgi:hypothetical protein